MTTATAHRGAVPATHRSGFQRLMLSELTKIRSVRSTVWSLILLVVTCLGFTTLFVGLTVAQWDDEGFSDGDKASIILDPTSFYLGTGVFLGQLTICVLGVMVIASEYSTGMIRASVLAVPKRIPMLAAKAVVFGLLVFVIGLVVAFGQYLIGSAFMGDKVDISLGDPGVFRAVVGEALYLAVLGLFALAIGALVRHSAAGITGVIAFVLVLSPLAELIPGKAGDYVHAYLPSNAGVLIIQAKQADKDLLAPWEGFGVFCLWTVVMMVAAAILLKKRDV